MLRRLPPLNAVRAFEAVARNGSVTRAARELSVTQGAVSRHVGTLEEWLGAKLFVRTQRGVTLTRRKGPPTFARCAAHSTRSTTRRASCSKVPDESLLRLKLPPTFAIRWLVPRLARFHALHPRIDVQITTSHERADFDREDIDACIHSEREPPAGPGFRRLVGEVLLPVCSPRLLTRGLPLATARRPRAARAPVLAQSSRRLAGVARGRGRAGHRRQQRRSSSRTRHSPTRRRSTSSA